MAHSEAYLYKDLTECGICLTVIEEPKALPCLHSFCLKCLSKWAEGKEDTVKCPICAQDFIIPPEGIIGFVTNFFINTLKDRKETAEKLQAKDARIPCSCCGASDNKAGSYCTECGGFICEECGGIHKRVLAMQTHKTIPFADLQSGKVDIKSIMREECCKEHKGQVLRFYCKTCGILICHECTVIDHPGTSHTLVNLKCATKEQRLEIDHLMTNCIRIKTTVEEFLKGAEKVKDNLEKDLKKAKADLLEAAEAVRAKVLAKIQQKEIELEANIIKAASNNKKQIDTQRNNLQMQQTRLHTALQMATEVTVTGSDYDFALTYSSLKNSLTQLKDITPEKVDGNLARITFSANRKNLPTMPSLGTLSVGNRESKAFPTTEVKVPSECPISGNPTRSKVPFSTRYMANDIGEWRMQRQFGEGIINNGHGIGVTPMTDFIIADQGFICSGQVCVYSHTGKLKFCVDTEEGLKHELKSRPSNAVVSPDGEIFITHQVPYVNVYGVDGSYKFQFDTKPPNNVSSQVGTFMVSGLAADNQGHLLVGEVNQKYISKHLVDGSHISSFKVTVSPGYIAVTMNDQIIISCGGFIQNSPRAVHVLDTTGNILRALNPPSGVSTWWPYGLCCTADYMIYTANNRSSSDAGIYCYSVSGQYLGCITKEVKNPAGLALTDDGNKLIVVEEKSVKIFSRA